LRPEALLPFPDGPQALRGRGCSIKFHHHGEVMLGLLISTKIQEYTGLINANCILLKKMRIWNCILRSYSLVSDRQINKYTYQ
jgi:hypothetical protein